MCANWLRRLALLARTSFDTVQAAQSMVIQDLGTIKTAISSIQSTGKRSMPTRRRGLAGPATLPSREKPRLQELNENDEECSEDTASADVDDELQPCTQRSPEVTRPGRFRYARINNAISSYWDENQTTYHVALRSKLPRLFGERALNLEFTIRHYALCWFGVSLLQGNISINNAISKDSAIMTACFRGDEKWVRDLFRNREAGPNDLVMNTDSYEPIITPLTVCPPRL